MKNFNLFTDDQLICLYLNGDSHAFDALVLRHKDRIYTVIIMLVKDESTADDIFQEVFIRIIKSLQKGSYAQDGKFLSWALCVAHNMCIDHFRAQKRCRVIPVAVDREPGNQPREQEATPMQEALGANTSGKLIRMLDRLPAEQREIIVLRHYADLSFKEIATLTHCSINTALGRMRYALANLRKQLDTNQAA